MNIEKESRWMFFGTPEFSGNNDIRGLKYTVITVEKNEDNEMQVIAISDYLKEGQWTENVAGFTWASSVADFLANFKPVKSSKSSSGPTDN